MMVEDVSLLFVAEKVRSWVSRVSCFVVRLDFLFFLNEIVG